MYRTLFIVLFVAFCGFSVINDTDKMVMAAAEDQLPVFLSKIPAGQEASYGFRPEDDLDLCKVGKPYRMLFFSDDFYKAPLDDDKNYILIKNEWRVPVLIDSSCRALLIMAGNPGNYTMGGLGDSVLAKELKVQIAGTQETDQFYILRIPRLRVDFFVSEANNSFVEARFTPLLSAIIALPSLSGTSKTSFTLTEVELAVKEALGKKK